MVFFILPILTTMKYFLSFLVVFFLCSSLGYGQTKEKDSFRTIADAAWKLKTSDAQKATLMLKHGLKLSQEYNDEAYGFYFYRKLISQKAFEKNLDSALYYYKISVEKMKSVKDSLDKFMYTGRLHSEMGEVYYRFSKLDKAKDEFSKATYFFRKEKDTIGIILGHVNIASVEYERGFLEKSLENYQISLDLFNREEKQYSYIKAAILNGLSTVYEQMGEIDESILYAEQSLQLDYVELERYPEKIGSSLHRLAALEFRKKNIEKAFKYLNRSDSIINVYKVESNKPLAATLRGKFLIDLKKYKEAFEVLSKVKLLLNTYNLAGSEQIDYYKSLGIANYHLRRYNQSLDLLSDIEEIAEKEGFYSQLGEIKKYLALNYKALNRNALAFTKLTESQKISDSIFNIDKQKVLKEIEAKYQTEKRENELLQVRTEKANAELDLSNQRLVTYGLIAGVLVLILIGFSVVQRNKRRHQLLLSEQKEQSLQSIIAAEEKERNRIARELHDGIVQQIGATILKSRNAFKKLGIAEEPESSELIKSLEASSTELRSISHQMMPRALEEKGLVSALEELLSDSLHSTNITHSFEHENIHDRLPKNIEVTLYRITQELIQNIVKHSEATEVNIQLMKTKNQILFLVEDNGVGFQAKSKKGIGLKNIQSRIDMIKGSVNFNSENSGTLTTVKIPV